MKALLIIHLIILLGLSVLTTQAMGECPIRVSTNDGVDSVDSVDSAVRFKSELNSAYPAVQDILIKKGYLPFYSNYANDRKEDLLVLNWHAGYSIIEVSMREYIQGVYISTLEMEKDYDDGNGRDERVRKAMDLLKSLARQIPPCEEFSKLKTSVTNNYNKWNIERKAANKYGLELKCDHPSFYGSRGGGEFYLTTLELCAKFVETTDLINQFSSRRTNQLQFWDYERNNLILSNKFNSFEEDSYTHIIKIDMNSVLDNNKKTIEDVMKYLELKQ